MAKELRIIRIHGKVQGVGYRFFATRVARRLGLKGWIENNRDATVEAMVEGEKNAIDEWLEELKEGPRYAEVTKIDEETKEFSGRRPTPPRLRGPRRGDGLPDRARLPGGQEETERSAGAFASEVLDASF